jgi:asparagine synthase (glutamine-hydrolysing)
LKRVGFLLERVDPAELRSHIFSQEQYFFTRQEIRAMARKGKPRFKGLAYQDPEASHLRAAEQQALFDLRFYLKDDLLVKVDRASMFYGLECRCPFLDENVIDLAMGLPFHVKKKGNERKWILKKILEQYLPEDLVYRPKWGFSIPLVRWLKNDPGSLIEKYLGEAMIRDAGIIEYEYVRKLKTSFAEGTDFLYNRLWVLIAAHKWLHENAR